MSFFKTRGALLATAVLTEFTFGPAAHAQDALEPARPESSASIERLGEVIVTARRTAESVQSVPISVQAFDADMLRERSVSEVRDLMFHVPGIYMGGTGSLNNTSYVLRGASTTGAQGQCSPATAGIASASTATGDASGPTWTIALNWQANDSVFLYATSRRGYRAGGLNGPQFNGPLAALQAFAPEALTDVELGMKLDWHLGTWRGVLNLDVFRAKTQDVQIGALQIGTGTYDQLAFGNAALLGAPPAGFPAWVPCFLAPPPFGTGTSFDRNCNTGDDPTNTLLSYNGATRRTKGIEAQAIVAPTGSLTLSVGASYYEHEFSAGAIPTLIAPYSASAGVTDPGQSLGARATGTAGVRYELPVGLALGQLSANADYYVSGKLQLAGYEQPRFDTVNFRVDWVGIMGSHLDLSVFVRNVFDERYAIGVGAFPSQALLNPALSPLWSALGNPELAELNARGAVAAIMGEPRMYGVQLRYRIGE